MAKIFYPNLFAELDVEETGDRIFRRFYGADDLYSHMAHELGLGTWD